MIRILLLLLVVLLLLLFRDPNTSARKCVGQEAGETREQRSYVRGSMCRTESAHQQAPFARVLAGET